MERPESTQDAIEFNPVGLDGMEFIEYATPDAGKMEHIFLELGFVKVGQHKSKDVRLFRQNDVSFILNCERNSFADSFREMHGPSICATGFRVKNSQRAFEAAVSNGARPCEEASHHSFPAIYGIGDSLIYFVENSGPDFIYKRDFNLIAGARAENCGLLYIDHMTNNVPQGQMQLWCDFYRKVFNFREVRYFDIQGQKTGLVSKVMLAPDNKICIPINEPRDPKSQIQEYINEYRGSGIQHVAMITRDMVKTVEVLKQNSVGFLSTPETYYEALPRRLPGLTENLGDLRRLGILADGDEKGYLLQIFTGNMIGPIFFEIIQRKNHKGFGEGNFQALFESIEEDQRRRGYI